MSYLAEFATAPTGTQWRTDSEANWQTASVGDKLYEDYQSENSQSQNYQVDLIGSAMMAFGAMITVDLSNVTGVVKYKNSLGNWVDVEDAGQCYADAIGTGSNGGVSITCSVRGVYRPPVWT